MHSGIEYWISNIGVTFFWMISANLILDNKYPKIRTVFIESMIQITLWFVTEEFFPIFDTLRFIIGFGLPVILLQYFHTDRWAFKLITAMLIAISLAFSEILVATMLPYDLVQSGEIFETNGAAIYSAYLFFNFTILAFLTAVMRSIKHRYKGLLVEKEWLLFSIFPFSQCFSVWGWISSYDQYNSVRKMNYIILMIFVFFLADLALIYMIRISAARAELKIRSEMLEEQVRSQGNYYDQLASTYAGMRRMRHDIDNHLYTIRALIDNGRTEDAVSYADKVIEEDHVQVHFSDCRNTVVSSYLEKKLEDMNALGIRLETDIHLPAHLSVSNPDLICIYGNILDNAIEASRETDNAVITLKTEYRKPYLTISCRNPVQVQENKKKQRIPGLERGVGLTILSHLAEQYDGQFTSKREQNSYYTEIILKAEETSDI